MCDCIEQFEKKIVEILPEQDPDFKNVKIDECVFENKVLDIKTGKIEITMPVKVTWKHTTKAGKEIERHKSIPVSISYCPFCGEKIDKGDKK